MSQKYVAPTLAASFSCPHCGALAHQTWFKAYASGYEKDQFPWPPKNVRDDINAFVDGKHDLEEKQKEKIKEHFRLLQLGEPFFPPESDECHAGRLMNADYSRCYSCKRFAVWVGSKIIYPDFTHDTTPNEDLPDDIKTDFREAQRVVHASPRGAAALLRLSIQKLCKHLGEKGKNINDDIGALVKKGLNVKVQKALDVVRVIGNEAVHPGQIDIRDDFETANKLFSLINLITDALITQPKMVDGLFDSIPQSKLDEINRRDN